MSEAAQDRLAQRRPAQASAIGWRSSGAQRVLRAVLYLGIALAVLPNGAVLEEHFLPAAMVIGLALLGACLVIPWREQTGRLFRATLVVLAPGTAYTLAQSLSFSGNPFAHDIWSDPMVQGIVGGAGAISVDPEATRRALSSFLLPFAAFLAAVALHDSDEAALRLWRRLAFFGTAIACFGLAEYFLTPDRLLFSERRHMQNAVTGVFVNRNTASTFFGVTLLLLVGVAIDYWRRIDARAFGRWLLSPTLMGAGYHIRFSVVLVFLVVTSLALVLTQSRAGVVASFAALAPVLVWAGLRYGLRGAPIWKRVAFSAGFAIVSLLVLLQMAARIALRIETQGLEDGRWCIAQGTMRAIADHSIWGTGLGTFERVFPSYREPECMFGGVIDIAHNVYLEAYLGLGLAAPILLIGVLWVLGGALLQGMRRRRYRFAAVIGIAIVFLVLLHSLFDFSLQIPGFSVYLAVALACAVSLAQGRALERWRP